MANLKDTIVLGNLTVTGKVTASEILNTDSNSNRFETVYANKLIGQGGGTYTLEIEANVENNAMKITTGYLDLIGTLHTSYISDSTNNFGIDFGTSDALELKSSGNIDLYPSNKDGSGNVNITCNAILLYPLAGSASSSPEFGRSSGGLFRFDANGNIAVTDAVGGGISLYPNNNNDMYLGTQTNHWKEGYFEEISAYTEVYTPSIQNSGGITISCGGNISLSANSAGGGYIDLNAKNAIRPNVSIIPSVTTANLGASGTPFNNVYGKNFYASSDKRLKENIIKSHLDYYNIINKIQLVNYTWKSDEQRILHHGLIAQQLKEILPEELHNHLISESTDDEKMMSVNDGKLVYFALGALQQQLHINNKLEHRIQKLEELIRGGQ